MKGCAKRIICRDVKKKHGKGKRRKCWNLCPKGKKAKGKKAKSKKARYPKTVKMTHLPWQSRRGRRPNWWKKLFVENKEL